MEMRDHTAGGCRGLNAVFCSPGDVGWGDGGPRRHRKAWAAAWGHAAAPGVRVAHPELWDGCSLAHMGLYRRAPRPQLGAGVTVKRRLQSSSQSILIAKTFNSQTLVFPEKCFLTRNMPSILIISKCLFPLLPQGAGDFGLEGTPQSFLRASASKQGCLQPPGFHRALPRSHCPKVATRGPRGGQLATGVQPAPQLRGHSAPSRPGPVGSLTSPPGTPNSAPALEGC